MRKFVAGLAAASQYTRQHRDEAVEIFAKWVPGLDPAVGKKAIQHISYDPRVSGPVMQAFETAEDDVLKNTLKGAARLNIPDQFAAVVHGGRAEIESRVFQRFAGAAGALTNQAGETK